MPRKKNKKNNDEKKTDVLVEEPRVNDEQKPIDEGEKNVKQRNVSRETYRDGKWWRI